MTLLQAIFKAGGFMRTAQLSSTILIRDNKNGPEIKIVNIDKILDGTTYDIPLKSYDIVYLPKTFIAQVNDFVDQYINQVIPRAVRFGFNFVYRLDDKKGGDRTIVVNSD